MDKPDGSPADSAPEKSTKTTKPAASAETFAKVKTTTVGFFKKLWAFLLHPTETIREQAEKYDEPKKALTLAGIMAGVMTLVNLISGIIHTVITTKTSYSLSGGLSTSTEINWGNLGKFDWAGSIFGSFITYAIVFALFATTYFVAGAIIKKKFSFWKSVSITAASFIPYILGVMILSPILSSIWAPLGFIAICAGATYTEFILVFAMSDALKLEKDNRALVNFLCATFLCSVAIAIIWIYLQNMASSFGAGSLDTILKSLSF